MADRTSLEDQIERRCKLWTKRAFAMPVFNYWHIQCCKSVLSTQQEKIHLHFALTQLLSSDQGLSLLQDDELAVNKVELQCFWMKVPNIVFTYTLKLRINKMAESFKTGINAYFLYIITRTCWHSWVAYFQYSACLIQSAYQTSSP